MPYVERDANGKIIGIYANRQKGYAEEFVETAAIDATHSDVDEERDRRIVAGFTFAGKEYQSRQQDQKRISGAGVLALGAIVAGAQIGDCRWHGGADDFAWIAADNSLTKMDAHTVFAFGQAAARHETLHVFAGKALKGMDPIPTDYTSDKYWP